MTAPRVRRLPVGAEVQPEGGTLSPDPASRFQPDGLFGPSQVVDNHLGPDGCAFAQCAPDYFARQYENEWGDALNFDGPGSAPVGEYFIANAAYWIDEFRLDGLRLDATQAIYDGSPVHVDGDDGHAAR